MFALTLNERHGSESCRQLVCLLLLIMPWSDLLPCYFFKTGTTLPTDDLKRALIGSAILPTLQGEIDLSNVKLSSAIEMHMHFSARYYKFSRSLDASICMCVSDFSFILRLAGRA